MTEILWVDPSQPSPTSSLGINVRFYQFDVGGQTVHWDIGESLESIAEKLYPMGYFPSVEDFETHTRGMIEGDLNQLLLLEPYQTLFCLSTANMSRILEVIAGRLKDIEWINGEVAKLKTEMEKSKPSPLSSLFTTKHFDDWKGF